MKIISGSKKGFTLIEVLLAVCILVIASTMILNGFMSTMNYSNNTSIYARSAGKNYGDAISNIAAMAKPDKTTAFKNVGSGETGTITFSNVAGAASMTKTVNVEYYRYNSGDAGSNVVGGVDAEHHATSPDDSTYANNRSTFYYYPKVNMYGTDEATRGEILLRRYHKIGETAWIYYWAYVDQTTGKHYVWSGSEWKSADALRLKY